MRKLWLLFYPLAVPMEAALIRAKTGEWNWKKAHRTIVNATRSDGRN